MSPISGALKRGLKAFLGTRFYFRWEFLNCSFPCSSSLLLPPLLPLQHVHIWRKSSGSFTGASPSYGCSLQQIWQGSPRARLHLYKQWLKRRLKNPLKVNWDLPPWFLPRSSSCTTPQKLLEKTGSCRDEVKLKIPSQWDVNCPYRPLGRSLLRKDDENFSRR